MMEFKGGPGSGPKPGQIKKGARGYGGEKNPTAKIRGLVTLDNGAAIIGSATVTNGNKPEASISTRQRGLLVSGAAKLPNGTNVTARGIVVKPPKAAIQLGKPKSPGAVSAVSNFTKKPVPKKTTQAGAIANVTRATGGTGSSDWGKPSKPRHGLPIGH